MIKVNCVVAVEAGRPAGDQGGAVAARFEQGATPLHGAVLQQLHIQQSGERHGTV
jgi:hypothetical protein